MTAFCEPCGKVVRAYIPKGSDRAVRYMRHRSQPGHLCWRSNMPVPKGKGLTR